MNYFGSIYGLQSPENKWYIGLTTHVDPMHYIIRTYKHHMGGGRIKINRALLKYGYENFHIEVFVSLFDKESLDKAEEGFIEMYNSIENGYNCKTGGFSGKHDDATKEIMRQKKLGTKASEETKRKMSEAHLGSKRTPEQCENIGNALRGKTRTQEQKDYMSEQRAKSIYEIQGPDGIIHLVTSLNKFALERGMWCSDFTRSRHGWKILSRKPKNQKEIEDVEVKII
jgi:group I intron endonuclease